MWGIYVGKNEYILVFLYISVYIIKELLFKVEYCKLIYICIREIFVKFLRLSFVVLNIFYCELFLVIYGICFNNINFYKVWS